MLRVNIIAWDNGVGLTRDVTLIAEVLRGAGFHVDFQSGRGRGKLRKWFGPSLRRGGVWWNRIRRGSIYDVNLMLEHIRPELLRAAKRNIFIPNPEWCLPSDVKRLARMDQVLAKTLHAVGIFENHGCHVESTGFTSIDRHDVNVPRRRTFFHLAGRSSTKRTELVLKTWACHPEWPMLTVVQHPRIAGHRASAPNIVHNIDYVDDVELRRLQNENLFHLCPSETEGFGHYLAEALSVGAITLTTDAEPMNELVTAERGLLIPFTQTEPQCLATRYQIDAAGLEAAVKNALALSEDEIAARSSAAREFYLRNDREFRQRLVQAVVAAAESPDGHARTEPRATPPYLTVEPTNTVRSSAS